MIAALAALLLSTEPPIAPPIRADCRDDSECIVSTFDGCCGSCCPRAPFAISRANDAAQQNQCAVIDCTRASCAGVRCRAPRPTSDFSAVCRRGVCQLVDAKPPPPAQCTSDSDCVISTSQGCCGGCCAAEPFAVLRADDEAQRKVCAFASCAAPHCEAVRCAKPRPASDFRAACRSGACVRVDAKPDRYACARDTDCRVDWPIGDSSCANSVCGCCPGTEPVAVHVNQPGRWIPPRPLTKKGTQPPFGLSPGGQPPNCAPCPAQPAARAVCSAERCVLER